MKARCLFFVLMLTTQSATAWFIDRLSLIDWCEARVQDTDIELGNACVAYVAAVHDTWDTVGSAPYCLPKGVGSDDLAKAVIDHAAASADGETGSAATFVTKAYKAAWPCRGDARVNDRVAQPSMPASARSDGVE